MIDSPDQLQTLNPYVSRETIKKLSRYRDSILGAKFNLVSKKDKEHIWIRHFHDSLRLRKFFEKNDKKIKNINIPVLVMHGEEDQIVPFKMGKELFEKANNPKFSYFSDNDDHMMEFNYQLMNALRNFSGFNT